MSNPLGSYRAQYLFDVQTSPPEIKRRAEPLYHQAFNFCCCYEVGCRDCDGETSAIEQLGLLRVRPPMRLL